MDMGAACWHRRRDDASRVQSGGSYFDNVLSGGSCDTNWYEGNYGRLGEADGRAVFSSAAAPALLGFDEGIDASCRASAPGYAKDWTHATRCVAANVNILSLYGNRVPYNICRNLEWQTCAAKGMLPGQGTPAIRFATAPSSLDPAGATGKPLGQCKGWVPSTPPTGGVYGFATDDVFFLEVCLFNELCYNGHELFTLAEGEEFICKFDENGLRELQGILLQEPVYDPPGAWECRGKDKAKG